MQWQQLRRTRGAFLLSISLLIAGCSGMSGDGITDLTLRVSVSDGVNPDRSGRPSPVFLQIYELRSPDAFRGSNYLDIYRDPPGTLGASYLSTSELGPLYPGTTTEETLRLTPTAVAVGVLGEFNRYQDMETPMDIVEFAPGEDATVDLELTARGLTLELEQ